MSMISFSTKLQWQFYFFISYVLIPVVLLLLPTMFENRTYSDDKHHNTCYTLYILLIYLRITIDDYRYFNQNVTNLKQEKFSKLICDKCFDIIKCLSVQKKNK